MPQQESQSQTQVTINTNHLHHNITVHSLQPPLHPLDVFCSRTKNRLSSEGVAQSTADSEEHDTLSGISWATLVQLSRLKPVSSQELSWGNLHTHTQYWELGSSPHYPATPSCCYVDEVPPGKQLQRESFIKTKFSHLSKLLGFFLQGFSRAQLAVSVQQPTVLATPCPGPAPASFSFLLHICPLGVRDDTFCECRSSILNSRWVKIRHSNSGHLLAIMKIKIIKCRNPRECRAREGALLRCQ